MTNNNPKKVLVLFHLFFLWIDMFIDFSFKKNLMEQKIIIGLEHQLDEINLVEINLIFGMYVNDRTGAGWGILFRFLLYYQI